MGVNPSFFSGVRDWPHPGTDHGNDLTRPVENVTWAEAVAYCVALTERERAAGRIAPSSVYRLPTEAEWEYACRAGTSTRFSYGNDRGYGSLTEYAWYDDNSGWQTHPVGQKKPNAWGLFDMHGNVWERCHDWFAYELPGGIVVDPRGPPSGDHRVIRGGSYYDYGSDCRSTCRRVNHPGIGHANCGFRVVLTPGQP